MPTVFKEFSEEISTIHEFLLVLASKEMEIRSIGFHRLITSSEYKEVIPLLRNFELRTQELESAIRPLSPTLFKKLTDQIYLTEIVNSVYDISTSLQIAEQTLIRKEPLSLLLRLSQSLPVISLLVKSDQLFAESNTSIKKTIVALSRLRNLALQAQQEHLKQIENDSDNFKPSNLDEEQIILYIEKAIEEIQYNTTFTSKYKKELTNGLNQAKREFTKKAPSWPKIIGALVITSALISGIPDSKGAYDNVESALKYILGKSVSSQTPNEIPLIQRPFKDSPVLSENAFDFEVDLEHESKLRLNNESSSNRTP